ncbi:SH3 domain-containing protein [Roseomonas sp. NAR14]|uniref:SH3 domain-containing protein n=1 Tax=Roseomonas acroporae TaxID=2937791 RepID=A0A9X2BWX0_9PROT|nr:SH3 domain-containing protein [Roseomonas acroporae]MCK8785369.1 SH3 domain-containing protein [Roseomonas acroporae]
MPPPVPAWAPVWTPAWAPPGCPPAAARRPPRRTPTLHPFPTLARLLAGLGLVLLVACDDKSDQGHPAAPDLAARARQAAEEKLRSGAPEPGAVRFRAVQSWPQAIARTVAVCGQANLTGAADDAFIPFVSVVSFEGDAARVDQHFATSSPEATRVYIDIVTRCFEGGGPQSARQIASSPLPPLPNDPPRNFQPPAAAPPAPPPGTARPAAPPAAAAPSVAPAPMPPGGAQRVTLRQNGNLRSAPVGGSTVLQVVQRGTTLRVFGQAPGGWYQVGGSEPIGWIHGSLLDEGQ